MTDANDAGQHDHIYVSILQDMEFWNLSEAVSRKV